MATRLSRAERAQRENGNMVRLARPAIYREVIEKMREIEHDPEFADTPSWWALRKWLEERA